MVNETIPHCRILEKLGKGGVSPNHLHLAACPPALRMKVRRAGRRALRQTRAASASGCDSADPGVSWWEV